jgi:hypothetical protein
MLEIVPFPFGKNFAVTFVDDTDLSTRDNTEPIYVFLRHHGFLGTKTVWILNAKRSSSSRLQDEKLVFDLTAGSTLEDSAYLDFVLNLRNDGFEIGLHNVSAGNTRREEILEGLERFRSIFGCNPAVNTFHQTNIENLYAGGHKLDSPILRFVERRLHQSEYQGHVESSLYFWGDIARDIFKYIRLPFHNISRVNTLHVNPSMPFRDPRRPYVREWFASSDGANVTRFNRLLSKDNLARLERERGACIVYTHFAKGFARVRDGRTQLNPGFVETVERLCSNPRVWLPTVSELLDRLAAVRSISLTHKGEALTLRNGGDSAVDGLTMRGPVSLEIRDAQSRQLPSNGGVWTLPSLPPGGILTLRTNLPGRQSVPFRGTSIISPLERRRLEYLNYLGLVHSAIRDRRDWRRAHVRTTNHSATKS